MSFRHTPILALAALAGPDRTVRTLTVDNGAEFARHPHRQVLHDAPVDEQAPLDPLADVLGVGLVHHHAAGVAIDQLPVVPDVRGHYRDPVSQGLEELGGGAEELRPVLERAGRRPGGETRPTRPPAEHGADAPDSLPTGGSHPVAVIEELVLHDTQRDKDLTLRITYPKAEGPFPVILLAHAVRRTRDDFKPLAEHWAAAGYVVLQADHADTGRMGQDWRDRARDMSFLIDSLAEIESKAPQLASKIDAKRIGASGHLIGAYATCALAGMKGTGFGPGNETADFMDPRVDAALLLGPHGRGQELNEKSWEEIDKPMLVAVGSRMPSRRTSNPAEWRTEPYRFAQPGDKYLLWVEGMDGGYAGLCAGDDIDPGPAKCRELLGALVLSPDRSGMTLHIDL